jgi:hypothetical protein
MSEYSVDEKVTLLIDDVISDYEEGKITQKEFVDRSYIMIKEYFKSWDIDQVNAALNELGCMNKKTMISDALRERRDELMRK